MMLEIEIVEKINEINSWVFLLVFDGGVFVLLFVVFGVWWFLFLGFLGLFFVFRVSLIFFFLRCIFMTY